MQWNPSKTDTIGEIKSVLYTEASFIHLLFCLIIARRDKQYIKINADAVRILTVN